MAPGLFDGTRFERPVTCEVCQKPLLECRCPRDAAGNVLLPKDQTAVVRTEQRAKGKVVTLVDGLEPSAADLPSLLKSLKSRCAAGGTVAEGIIEIQGEHRDAVARVLKESGFRVRLR